MIASTGAAAASRYASRPATRSPLPGLPAVVSAEAKAIAAGPRHTCALTTAGGVRCWGANFQGALGDGTTTDRHAPVAVSGLAGGVTAISAGGDLNGGYSCALTSAGGIKCWGDNGWGQLGDGTTTERHRPVDVSGLAGGVAAISAGGDHTCALTSAGGVKCWGHNVFGQLGDGTTTERHAPVDVSGLGGGVAAISAGESHSCALMSAGGVKCWGFNLSGQLGDGTTIDRHAPVDVSGLGGGVAAIAAGVFHTCALTTAGGVMCWGDNTDGELGDGTTTERHAPVDVLGLAGGVAAVSVGALHTCALTSAGEVKCWGFNGFGQLGDGTRTKRYSPVDVVDLAGGVGAISAGSAHSCALTRAGEVKCWGANDIGQLGDGTTTDRRRPVGVIGFGARLPPVRCVVPNVLGKPLANAKVKIKRAHCRVGTVMRVASRKRKSTVVGERPRPGKRLKKGAKVSLKVSRGG